MPAVRDTKIARRSLIGQPIGSWVHQAPDKKN